MVSSLALAGVILWFSPLNGVDSRQLADDLGQRLAGSGLQGLLLALLGGTLATAVGVPRQLVALVCGYGFGLAAGLSVAVLACGLGAITTFTVSRHLLRDRVRRRFPTVAHTLERFTREDAFLKILIIRFLPIGTNMLTNLAAGTTHLRARTFFTASIVGFLPQTGIFVLIGNGLNIGSTDQLLLAGALTLVALGLSAWLYRKHRASLTDSAR